MSAKPVPISVDGGWGWMVILGSFLAYFLADGWSYSFGVLFPGLLENFGEGKAKTALIAALLYGVPMMLSPVACAMTTCYGCRKVAMIGGAFTGISIVISAFATSVNFLCITIGILNSIGLGMTYIPAIVIVTFYFEKRRGLATGLAVTGSGLGAICFPPIMEYLCNGYAWRGYLIIAGGLCLNIIFAGALFRPPPMGIPKLDEDEEKLVEKSPETTQDIGKSKIRNVMLLPRLHDQHKKEIQSCMDLDRCGTESRFRFIGASALSLHCAGRFNGAVAIEMDNLYDQPMSVSNPDIFATEDGTDVTNVHVEIKDQNSITENSPKTNHFMNFVMEIRMIMRTMCDKSLVTNVAFLMFCGSNFLLYLWVGVPYIFLIDRALELRISGDLFFLSSIIGIGRTVGQIIMGYLGDHPKVDCNMLYGVSVIVIGISTILVPLCNNYTSLCVYSAVFGFFVSVTYAIQMMCVVDIVGIERTTSAFGLQQMLQGIATILGTPLAGWLYDITGGYNPTFYTSGAWTIFSGVTLLPVYFLIRRNTAQT